MSFTNYKNTFFIFSFLMIVGMFSYTFYVHDGFAKSISFNGGIRLSIVMPAGKGKADLEEAATKAGYKNFGVRLTDPRLNSFDLELGPELRDAIEKKLTKKRKEQKNRIRELQAQEKPVPNELMHRTTISDEIAGKILPILNLKEDRIISRETIAASYGDEIGYLALRMMIFTLIAIGLYLTFRFDFPFALGASAALIHDILITIAFIGFMQIKPSIPVLAAVLTIVGYSINDTIVIFDRIRENVNERQQATLSKTIDFAIIQTLSRTIVTSVLTLLAALALFLGGESSLKDFALILIFGIIIGTYSSIYIASNAVQLYESFRDRIRT